MKAEHTSGPWEVTRLFVPVHADFWVKTVFGRPGDDDSLLVPAAISCGVNAEANARLIAASPELLAACEKIQRWIEKDTLVNLDDPSDDARAILEMLNVVIALATQPSPGSPP